ncbi:MAG: GAF domain-containing sensor histidine kinase [Chloroflexi bacterium]|nr:GAF domain-containing sensor histidine kinase [Chloroflexota bacterium]
MMAIYFISGLAAFSLGLAVLLENRDSSRLPLGGQLPWLAAFGFAYGLVEWLDMFLGYGPSPASRSVLITARSILLPLSALLLVRFGVGLVNDAGPIPDWIELSPILLIVPFGLLLGYALVVALTSPSLATAADMWSRYLLFLPGNILAAFGFYRQWRGLKDANLSEVRGQVLGASIAFVLNALVVGLIVSPAPHLLAPWLNDDMILALTRIPVQFWRMVSSLALLFFVVRALNVFEAERRHQLKKLDEERTHAQDATLRAQLEARQVAENWTDALVSLSRRVANMDNVDDTLMEIVAMARRLLDADTAVLGLWDENMEHLLAKCYATLDGAFMANDQPVTINLILKAIRSSNPSRYPEDFRVSNQPWECPFLNREVKSTAIVPLHLEDQSFGGLWVARVDERSFSPTDIMGLERLADQAVIAIEHALMTKRVQSLAIYEERTRIAREMHDGVAQILGYLNLEMQTLESLLEQGDNKTALSEIRKAKQSIKLTHDDVRENILSLRTTLSGEEGLIPALEKYVSEFGIQTGIDTHLMCDMKTQPHLSPVAEAQLVRIIQEALANVRKHAHASQVQVNLACHDHSLCTTITDDGIGFANVPTRGHYGLATMRERAKEANGGLTITSRENEGTQVKLWLPLMQQ